MPIRHLHTLLPLLFLLGIVSPLKARNGPDDHSSVGSTIDYEVSVDVPKEEFLVTGAMHGIKGDTITYYFPLWGPGAYDQVNFGGWVGDLTAVDGQGKNLRVIRVDTATVRIIGASGDFTIRYRVRDIEHLDQSPWFGLTDIEPGFVFANTVAVFGYPDGYKDVPHTVRYVPPQRWRVSVGLDPIDSTRNLYRAADYDELVDAPIQMGDFQRVEFSVNGIPHIITIIAPQKLTNEQLSDVRRVADTVVRTVSGFFGDMPYKRYVFQLFLVGLTTDYSFGALEHRNSSSYRMPVTSAMNGAFGLAGVFAHEYWHIWSPKRIHVHQLGPFDYQNPLRTKSIWFAEGLTEYYAQVLLSRAGIPTDDRGNRSYLEGVFDATYGRRQSRSMADLSMHSGEITMAQFIAFYSKGPVIGILLDAAIRKRTGYRKSLDDAMRYMNDRYGREGRSFSDDEIITIIEESTGAKLTDFYTSYIDGVEPLPFDEFLPVLGLQIRKTFRTSVMMGIEVDRVNGDSGLLVITGVDSGASGHATGLRAGDTIISQTMKGLRSERVEPSSSMPRSLFRYPVSTRLVAITVRRDGTDMTLPVKRVTVDYPILEIVNDPQASPEAVAARQSILGK